MATDRLGRLLVGSFAAFAAVTVPVMRCERQLRAADGRGIVALELAGTPERGAAVLAAWGPSGRAVARRLLLLDFGYQISYAVFGTLLIAWTDRRAAAAGPRTASADLLARTALALPGAAAVCDAVEGVALLAAMDRGLGARAVPARAVAPALRVARLAALTKFGALALALGHAGARSGVLGGLGRSARCPDQLAA